MTERKRPELLIKQCPFCLEFLVWDARIWAYTCPNSHCRTEVYRDPLDTALPPEHSKPDPKYICRSMVGTTAPGGSSSGKRYGAKERMKKPTPQEIYNRLCKR